MQPALWKKKGRSGRLSEWSASGSMRREEKNKEERRAGKRFPVIIDGWWLVETFPDEQVFHVADLVSGPTSRRVVLPCSVWKKEKTRKDGKKGRRVLRARKKRSFWWIDAEPPSSSSRAADPLRLLSSSSSSSSLSPFSCLTGRIKKEEANGIFRWVRSSSDGHPKQRMRNPTSQFLPPSGI